MSYRIVIAEDEFLLARNLKALVESLDHEVSGVAETGPQAITLADTHHPDLVLMDIKMPEVDGLTATETILHRHNIPIIIISAFSNSQYVERAAAAGVMTYLIKPVTLGDLRAAIDLTMARFHELQTLRHEIGDLKNALIQRKIVERAKGILMDRCHLAESEAFRLLQQASQRENRPMVEIAQAVITTNGVWKGDYAKKSRCLDTESPEESA